MESNYSEIDIYSMDNQEYIYINIPETGYTENMSKEEGEFYIFKWIKSVSP